jgi:hypothetical protein
VNKPPKPRYRTTQTRKIHAVSPGPNSISDALMLSALLDQIPTEACMQSTGADNGCSVITSRDASAPIPVGKMRNTGRERGEYSWNEILAYR